MKTLSLLYADDDDDDCLIFREILADINFTGKVVIVNDGNQVMAKVRLSTIVLTHIFLDINMPGINGIDCLRTIRSMDAYKSVPVVMLTSEINQAGINTCFQLGANRFMLKPNSFLKYKVMLLTILSAGPSTLMDRVKTNFLIS